MNHLFGTNYTAMEELPFSVKTVMLPKNHIITDYNQVERSAYFMLDGIAQVEMMNKNMEVRIIDFFFPGNFFNSYTSFLLQEPSIVQLKTVTKCQIHIIDHDEIKELYKTSLLINQLGRILTEGLYLQKVQRERDFLTKSAEEMYHELQKSKSDLLQQIPNYKIAQYLGIQPESLSRIRKKLIS